MSNSDVPRIIRKTNKVLKDYGYPEICDESERMLAISASIKASQDLRLRGTFAVIGAFSLIGVWIASGGIFNSQYAVVFLAMFSISSVYSYFTIIDVGSRDATSAILNHRASNLE
ncbi:hypothetical protein AB3F22_06800 [Actinomyces johnsonii]|uniref:hypothetical protein n=1 Tax=Actinomyces johnsonii TaxID=544581 RepID=UPI0012E311E5|nr:hypothetical protein [Actinomyces johnsonii]